MKLRRLPSMVTLVHCLRTISVATVGLGATLLLSASPVAADDHGNLKYNGIETLELVTIGLNEARYGEAPNFEAVFEGEGLDTAGGVFTAVSSGCQNIVTGEVFDLVAVDTYANGDTMMIEASSFFMVFDPQTCASSNADPIPYVIAGGTGTFAGASGGGMFDFATNDPGCNGWVTPSYVSFRGKTK